MLRDTSMFKTTELITGSTMQEAFDNAVKAAERRVLDNPPENPDEAPFTLVESEGFITDEQDRIQGLSKVEAIATTSIIDCKFWDHSTVIANVVDESTLGDETVVEIPLSAKPQEDRFAFILDSAVVEYMENNRSMVVVSAEVSQSATKKTAPIPQSVVRSSFYIEPVDLRNNRYKSKSFDNKPDAVVYAEQLAREGIDTTLELSEVIHFTAVGVERSSIKMTVREITPETKPLAGQWWAMSDYTPPR